MVSDEELDNFIEKELKPEIDQSDKIDTEQVDKALGEMGYLWEAVNLKLKEDGYCFSCKRSVDFSSEKVNVLQVSKTEKGVIAFVSVCQKCFLELINKKEGDEIKNEKENEECNKEEDSEKGKEKEKVSEV